MNAEDLEFKLYTYKINNFFWKGTFLKKSLKNPFFLLILYDESHNNESWANKTFYNV